MGLCGDMAVVRRTCERCLKEFIGDTRYCEDCIERMWKTERRRKYEKGLTMAVVLTGILGFLAVLVWMGMEDHEGRELDYCMGLLSVMVLLVIGLVSMISQGLRAGKD